MKVKETFLCWSHILSTILFYITFWSRHKSCVFRGSASLISALLKEILHCLRQSFDKEAAYLKYDEVFQLSPALATNITTSSLILYIFPPTGAAAPSRPGPPRYRCLKITLTHMTLGRSPLDE
jgi:hypothetical protein